MNQFAKRVAVVVALTVASLTVAAVPSSAVGDGTRLTIEDRPGAPGQVLREIERLAGQPLGDLDQVIAVDTGGRLLTVDQLEAVVAGKEVEGVQVRGTMPGRPEMLDTTLADLADGEFDGRESGDGASTVLFATSVPEGRDWCLTMCIARGHSVRECMLARLGGDGWLTLTMAGTTTLGGVKAGLEKAGQMSSLTLARVDTYVGDEEPSEQDLQDLAAGRDVGSLRRAATVEAPSPDWALDEVAGKSGVAYAKTTVIVIESDWPLLGHILIACHSTDGGKHYRCLVRAFGGNQG
ncbi:hypothetical protein HDA40_008088 [Hamadaea flava]|uniref:Uncharacterized protein n=1 Tax=Hamadaea flava TaxID=1742688 RepID=A0ABV8LN05_9ACTN|nr:hypothetical protein [Hamadaea flava]MCP2329581.1 hypothetical protein [Hamadaea flava]